MNIKLANQQPAAQEEERCDCGKLLFKRTSHGFEFRCHRCKRTHLIPFDWISSEYRHLCPIIPHPTESRDGGIHEVKRKI